MPLVCEIAKGSRESLRTLAAVLAAGESARQSRRNLQRCPGFQRQLLLFARMGCCWFQTLDGVWRTVPERHMAQFRSLAACLHQ